MTDVYKLVKKDLKKTLESVQEIIDENNRNNSFK